MICRNPTRTSILDQVLPTFTRGLCLLLSLGTLTIRAEAQPGFTSRTVVSAQDSLFAPSVVISPEGEVYLVYSRSDNVHHWLTQPERGSISWAIRREDPQGSPVSKGINLLAVDSGGSLHFASVFGDSIPCLQYGTTATSGANTVFDRLRPIEGGICGSTIDGVSSGIDRNGLLHILFQRNDSLFYIRRGSDGEWSPPVAIPATPPICRSPSLLISPSGEGHVTFSGADQPEGPFSLYYYSVEGSSPPTLLAQPSGTAQGVAPIAMTPDGRLHVAFSDEVDGGPVIQLLSRDLLDRWGPPEIAMQGGGSDVGDLSLAADRFGALHIASTIVPDGGPGDDREILYVENADGIWSQPILVTADDAEEVATNRGNGFLAIHDSLLLLPYSITRSRTGLSSIELARSLLDFAPRLGVVTRTLELGRVNSSRVDTTLIITNLGRRLYEPLLPEPTDTIRTDDFTVFPLFAGPPEPVRGGDSLAVPLRLSFSREGSFEYYLRIGSNGGVDSILIRGEHYNAVVPGRTLQIDTAVVAVGARQVLGCRISPPLEATDRIASLSLRISIDPDALFPHALSPAADDLETPWTYDGEGEITVELYGRDGGYVTGEKLFALEFEGLLTAMPANEVKVELLPGTLPGEITLRSGLMFVDGCETGRLLPFAKGGFVGVPSPNPADNEVALQWIAPDGVPTMIRIYDAGGTFVDERRLPRGNGQVQQVNLDLASLPSGLYFLELRTGAARTWDRLIRE